MFNGISEKVADKLLENQTITVEDKEIYQFGVRQIFIMTLNMLTVIAIGVITKMLSEAILFMIIFMPLRIFAGGFHSRTAIRCYVYSSLIVVAALLTIKFFPLENFICNLISLISGVFIFLSVPIDTENKKLDNLERKVYKKRARIILITEIALQILLSFILPNNYIMCFSLTFVILSVILVMGIIRNVKSSAKKDSV